MSSHIRWTFGGQLVTGQRWSIGIASDGPAAFSPPLDLTTQCNSMFTQFNTQFWSAASSPYKSQVGAQASLDRVQAYMYIGNVTNAVAAGVSNVAAVPGTGSTVAHPPQIALVFSLKTGFPGRSARGRAYLPNLESPVGTDGRVAQNLQTFCTNFANFLAGMRTVSVAGTACTPFVYSNTLQTGNAITSVSVDDVLDTQRRRRDQVSPSVTRVAAVPVG